MPPINEDMKHLQKKAISTIFGLLELAQTQKVSDSIVLNYFREERFEKTTCYVGIPPKVPTRLKPPFDENDVKACEESAKVVLQNKTVLREICNALKPGVQDLYDTTKTLGPVFITLSATGEIDIPLTPLMLVVIAVLVLKMGVEGLSQKKKPL